MRKTLHVFGYPILSLTAFPQTIFGVARMVGASVFGAFGIVGLLPRRVGGKAEAQVKNLLVPIPFTKTTVQGDGETYTFRRYLPVPFPEVTVSVDLYLFSVVLGFALKVE